MLDPRHLHDHEAPHRNDRRRRRRSSASSRCSSSTPSTCSTPRATRRSPPASRSSRCRSRMIVVSRRSVALAARIGTRTVVTGGMVLLASRSRRAVVRDRRDVVPALRPRTPRGRGRGGTQRAVAVDRHRHLAPARPGRDRLRAQQRRPRGRRALGVAVIGTVLTSQFTNGLPAALQDEADSTSQTLRAAHELGASVHAEAVDAFTDAMAVGSASRRRRSGRNGRRRTRASQGTETTVTGVGPSPSVVCRVGSDADPGAGILDAEEHRSDHAAPARCRSSRGRRVTLENTRPSGPAGPEGAAREESAMEARGTRIAIVTPCAEARKEPS